MPNWCSNRMEVIGDKDYLDKLEAAANENKLFETVKPIGNWEYNTAINEWGTKWDANEATPDRLDDTHLQIYFDSAWGPPIGVYEHLISEAYEGRIESVEATYFEPGMGFVGKWDNGEDMFWEDIGTLVQNGEVDTDPELSALNEEYGFSDWYEDEEEELSTWMEEGAKAREKINE